MSLRLPEGVGETDDVIPISVHGHLTVHQLGSIVTPCGIPMWSVTHPLPAAGHVLHLSPQWCPRCWPQESPWAQMLALAYPSRFRTADVVNPSYTHASPSNERSGR